MQTTPPRWWRDDCRLGGRGEIFQEILADCTLPEGPQNLLMEHVLNGRFFSDNLDPFWVKSKAGITIPQDFHPIQSKGAQPN